MTSYLGGGYVRVRKTKRLPLFLLCIKGVRSYSGKGLALEKRHANLILSHLEATKKAHQCDELVSGHRDVIMLTNCEIVKIYFEFRFRQVKILNPYSLLRDVAKEYNLCFILPRRAKARLFP